MRPDPGEGFLKKGPETIPPREEKDGSNNEIEETDENHGNYGKAIRTRYGVWITRPGAIEVEGREKLYLDGGEAGEEYQATAHEGETGEEGIEGPVLVEEKAVHDDDDAFCLIGRN